LKSLAPAFALLLSSAVMPSLISSMASAEDQKAPEAQGTEAANPNAKFVTKLAGLVLFVSNSCPGAKVDYDRFKATVTSLGVQVDALSAEPMKLESLNYFTSYEANAKDNCARALTEFGTEGRIIRGIFSAK